MVRGRGGRLRLAMAGLAAVLAPLAAGVAAAAQPPSRPIECRCRADGRTYELGARVCLRTPSGYRVAECRMVQNVTSWRFGGEDCSLSASLAAAVAGADTGRPRPR